MQNRRNIQITKQALYRDDIQESMNHVLGILRYQIQKSQENKVKFGTELLSSEKRKDVLTHYKENPNP